jgi:hypothetical protein
MLTICLVQNCTAELQDKTYAEGAHARRDPQLAHLEVSSVTHSEVERAALYLRCDVILLDFSWAIFLRKTRHAFSWHTSMSTSYHVCSVTTQHAGMCHGSMQAHVFFFHLTISSIKTRLAGRLEGLGMDL